LSCVTCNFTARNLGYRTILYFKQKIFNLSLILLGFFTFNCAGTDPPDKANDQNVDYLIEQGKILWEQRTDPVSLNKAEHFIHLAHQQRPEDFQLSVLLGNIKYTKAYFFETNP